MPAAKDVRPHAWANIKVLYDDGRYSAIWGDFKEHGTKDVRSCLGVRWNGAPGVHGYPSHGANPVWYVEPYFLTEVILLRLQQAVSDPTHADREDWLANIGFALSKYREKGATGY